GPLQGAIVDQLSQEGHRDRTAAQVVASFFAVIPHPLVDVELFIQLLEPVLDAAKREVVTPGNRPVRQPEGDVDEDLVFDVSKAIGDAVALLLHAAYLAVDDALRLHEDAAQRKLELLVGS